MKTRMFVVLALSSFAIFVSLIAADSSTAKQTQQTSAAIPLFSNHSNTHSELASVRNSMAVITFTPIATTYLPLIANNYPWPVYLWLSSQQDNGTGLLSSQQDYSATTYGNALAVMAFTLEGDYARARRILDFFSGSASEFFKDNTCNSFALSCGQTHVCGSAAPCGFFQSRNVTTGIPFQNIDRWMGDNAWLALAIHYYQTQTGDTSYNAMANAIVRFLKTLQQSDGHIANGWKKGDQQFDATGYAEGNLSAYKPLLLYGEAAAAQQIKRWLDNHNFGIMVWEKGPLDLHSWRVGSLGKEYGYSLPDTERTDTETLRYKSTVYTNHNSIIGLLPVPAAQYYAESQLRDNIWVEGTGQMAVAFCKAGYGDQWKYYTGELGKLLFQPVGFTNTQALPYLARPDPKSYLWVDVTKGDVSAVTWYIFAVRHFDPFDGVMLNCSQPVNPIVQIEAENFVITSPVGVRLDGRGVISEGNALHIGGDDITHTNDSGWAQYKFNVITPITITNFKMRYADDVGGDAGVILLNGSQIASFNTIDTGTWDDYIMADFSVSPFQLQTGLYTLTLQVTDNGTYGFTVDYFQMEIPPSSHHK